MFKYRPLGQLIVFGEQCCSAFLWRSVVAEYSLILPFPFSGVHSVLVLGPGDGRGNLSDVARSLCESIVQHRVAVGEIDSSFINSKLIGTCTCMYSMHLYNADVHVYIYNIFLSVFTFFIYMSPIFIFFFTPPFSRCVVLHVYKWFVCYLLAVFCV